MKNKPYCVAMVVAAGKGTRMGTSVYKQFLKLNDKEVIAHTLEKFQSCDGVDEIIIVTGKDTIPFMEKEVVEKYHFNKVIQVIAGGAQRQDSVYNGLCAVNHAADIIVVHDGVRPFVTKEDIQRTIEEALVSGACALGVRAKDTIKICAKDNIIVETPDRSTAWYIQTPQTFQVDILKSAFEQAKKDGFLGSDEAVLVERMAIPVRVVEGSYNNIKITTKEDLYIGEVFLKNLGG